MVPLTSRLRKGMSMIMTQKLCIMIIIIITGDFNGVFDFRKIKVRLKKHLDGHLNNTFNWSTDVSQMAVIKLRKFARDRDESGNLLKDFCKVCMVWY